MKFVQLFNSKCLLIVYVRKIEFSTSLCTRSRLTKKKKKNSKYFTPQSLQLNEISVEKLAKNSISTVLGSIRRRGNHYLNFKWNIVGAAFFHNSIKFIQNYAHFKAKHISNVEFSTIPLPRSSPNYYIFLRTFSILYFFNHTNLQIELATSVNNFFFPIRSDQMYLYFSWRKKKECVYLFHNYRPLRLVFSAERSNFFSTLFQFFNQRVYCQPWFG